MVSKKGCTKKVYGLRVLFKYEGDARKPTDKEILEYVSSSLSTSRADAPGKTELYTKDGRVGVRAQNDVCFSVALFGSLG